MSWHIISLKTITHRGPWGR